MDAIPWWLSYLFSAPVKLDFWFEEKRVGEVTRERRVALFCRPPLQQSRHSKNNEGSGEKRAQERDTMWETIQEARVE